MSRSIPTNVDVAPNASDEDAAVQGRSQLVADQLEHTLDVSLNLYAEWSVESIQRRSKRMVVFS